jgi:hypothetical protein
MRRAIGYLLFLLVFALSTAFGQTFRGAINGTVTDSTGAVIAGATVTATDVGTNIAHSMAATGDGQFSFQDLPTGTYSVKVIAAGFQTTTVSNVTVTAGNVYTVAAQLTVGQQATTVEVAAAAVVVDTTTSTQSDTLSSTTVQDIPLNGRDFTQMIAVSPGYGGYSVGGYGSLNGTRANQMNWQIDGTDNNDFWHNIPAVNQGGVSGIAGTVMPIDAVDEFSAQSQSNAETGRSAGGTVNLTIKSGTNQFHGSGYYYNRNEFYAASSPFLPATQTPPPIRNFNTGFTLGGPIRKDKTFFFIGFEQQQYVIGLSGLSTEPSTAWINQAQQLLSNPGGKYGSYAPVPVSGVSASLFSALYPTNIAGLPATVDNYFASDPSTGFSHNGIVKVDHNFNDKERLSFHYFVGQGSQTAPTGTSLALGTASSNLGEYFEVAPLHVQNYSIVLNSVLSPKFTNQLLAGVSSFYQIFHDADNSFNMKDLGLYLSPDASIDGKPIMGASQIVIGEFDRVGVTPPEGRKDITGHLTDIVSYITGAHQFRFGGEFRQGRVDEFYFRRGTGSFNFDGTQGPWAAFCANNATVTGCDSNTTALADFLAGNVSTSSIAVGDAERQVLVNGFDVFGQDDWQITSKLNLNFGLRYEYFGPLHANNGPNDIGEFIPGQGLVIPNSLFKPDRNNFAPRFGFAYAPFGGLVVRGGFGVFFDQININPFLDFRPPIGAADGLEDNPIGPHPVDSYSRNGYNWQAVQAGGASVFPGVTTCLGNNATDPNCNGGVFNVYGINPNLRAPYFFNYNLNVEKSLGGSMVWQIGYVGSQGRKLSVVQNINQNGAYDAQYPNYGSILQMNSIGTSNYNSLQTTLKIRSWHGLSGQFAFTWAHALDEVTEYRATIPHDSFDLAADYGSSDFDTRLNFTTYLNYEVPGFSHGPRWLTNGWQLSSLISIHSGQPFNPLIGNDPSGTQRPGLNVIGNPFAGVNHSFNLAIGGAQWINVNAFCVPGADGCAGTTNPNGDLGRNVFTGPGFADVDFSVFKNFTVKERFRVQLRAEMYNLFNRINLASGAFSVGGTGVVSDTIGDFNGAPGIGPGEPFNMQLVGKVIF